MFFTCQKLACPNAVLLALDAPYSDRVFKRALEVTIMPVLLWSQSIASLPA